MRKKILIALVAAVTLTGCMSDAKNKVSFQESLAQRERSLLFDIRSAQAEYEAFLKVRAERCKTDGLALMRDADGVLVCAQPQATPQANK